MMADLSDPARFAYASLVTLVWKEKYQDDVNEDQDFRDESIRCLLQYLELAKVIVLIKIGIVLEKTSSCFRFQCEPAMQMLLIDENCQSSDPFLQMSELLKLITSSNYNTFFLLYRLSEEPDLKADGSLVISNALQWALRKGKYIYLV